MPLVLAGASLLAALSPDAAAMVSHHLAAYVPKPIRTTPAALWFDGHESIALIYLSAAFFFVTRTVTRLLDR